MVTYEEGRRVNPYLDADLDSQAGHLPMPAGQVLRRYAKILKFGPVRSVWRLHGWYAAVTVILRILSS